MEVEYVTNESSQNTQEIKPKNTKKSKVINHVEDGDILVVDKDKIPQKEIVEISHKQAEKIRPKKELTEKQKVALQALIERNKKRFAELKRSKDVVKNPEELTEIDEDKTIVVVKPKRSYNKNAERLGVASQHQKEVPKKVKKVVVEEEEILSDESDSEYEEDSNTHYVTSQLLRLQKEIEEMKKAKSPQIQQPAPKQKVVHKYSNLSIF
jgi:hypothetical protein